MKRIPRLAGLGLVAMLLITAMVPVLAEGDEPTATINPNRMSQDQVWHLLRDPGDELYQQLCSSCHGLDGKGSLAAARALQVPPPDLTRLQEMGIPKQHWAYVLRSACEDKHHHAADGTATMPCWQRIFRHTLGSDARAFPIVNRLVAHLDSIQEIEDTEDPSPAAGEEGALIRDVDSPR